MRITVITCPFLPLPPDAVGAVERRWFNVCKCLAQRGHYVEMVSKRGQTILRDEPCFHHVYLRNCGRTCSVYTDILVDFFYSLRALWLMRETDILICNTFWTPILAPILFPRKYKRLVYNVARFPRQHLCLYSKVHEFVCTSTPIKEALCEMFPRYATRVQVVANPINVSVFNADIPLREESFLVGYHGRICYEKGLDILVSAIARIKSEFPQLKLRLIGPVDVARGGSGESYQKKLNALLPDDIEWVSAISDPKELADSLRDCMVYCYPSVAERGETFGVSPLEAMGLGLPVVLSNLKCFQDYAVDGVNSLSFQIGMSAVDECAGCLRRLLTNDRLRQSLSVAAAMRAKEFSVAVITEQYESKFRQLIANEC